MTTPDDEPRTWTPREGTVLAGVRNVAWGAAMVMAGLLAVILADCIWMVYFRLDAGILSDPHIFCMFSICDPWVSLVKLVRADSIIIIGLTVLIWLIGRVVRRALRSISAHRSFS